MDRNGVRIAFAAIVVVLGALSAQAQPRDAEYYTDIQRGVGRISAEEFAKLETDTLRNFASAAPYPPLTKAFSATTARVWGVIYGELFINLSKDEELRRDIGSLVFRLYDDAIVRMGPDKLSISLNENTQVNAANPVVPFEIHFEMSTVLGLLLMETDDNATGFRPGLEPLTIRALTDTRRQQLSIWQEKGLLSTELIRWQQRLAQSGHFEAYSYWMFRAARPDEFEEWLRSHQAEYAAWNEWHQANRLQPTKPDFHRLHLRSRGQ